MVQELSQEQSQKEGSGRAKRAHLELLGVLYSVGELGEHLEVPNKAVVTVGRSRSNDVVVKGADVSTVHCELRRVASKQAGRHLVNIVDRSSNGTFVNGQRLVRADQLLRNGDHVSFAGRQKYLFKYDEAVEQAAEAGFFDKYVVGAELGAGHYATVKEALAKASGQRYAVKIFKPFKSTDHKSIRQAKQEFDVLFQVQHRNVVRLVESFVEPVQLGLASTYLVLEKISGGELFNRIVRKGKLRVDETLGLLRQILQGVEYLHQNGIIHRDIKPENVLLEIQRNPGKPQLGPWDDDETDIVVKIADFGLSKVIGELNFTNTLCGTPAYVAPEVLAGEGSRRYSTKVDLWSCGVVLYVCLAGFSPFNDEFGPPSMKEQIRLGRYEFYSPFFDHVPDHVLDLITKLLVVDPTSRLDASGALGHAVFAATGEPVEPEQEPVQEQEQEH